MSQGSVTVDTMNVLKLVDKESDMPIEHVSLKSLAEMVGFPIEMIKKELLIESDDTSMNELRASVMKFLVKSIPDSKS